MCRQKLIDARVDVNILERGLLDSEYRRIGQILGFVGIQTSSVLGWTWEDWYDRMDRFGPFFAATQRMGGHAVVIRGFEKRPNQFYLLDPYTPGVEMASARPEITSLVQLRADIQPVDCAIQVLRD